MLKLKNRYNEEKICENPDKGWYIHYYDQGIAENYNSDLAPDDYLEDFPMLDHIYLRLAWGYLELEEGNIQWSLLDEVIDRWTAKGKKVAFRITCKETNKKLPYATPKWVFDAGAKGTWVKECMEPEYGDPIFLEKLENFHKAFAERYDNRDDVIYVDIGSYGDWGEGHTVPSSGIDWPVDVVKKHMDIYLRCYKNTQLIISDDVVGSRDTGTEEEKREILDYIIENGISIRDDGISVTWFAERYGFNTLRSEEIYDRAWRKFPTVLELEHYQTTLDSGWYLDGWPFLASVQGSHATYAGFHGFARKWLTENPEMAVMLGNAVGYWYFIYGVDMPEVATNKFSVKLYIENKGAAPSYKDYKLDFILRGDGSEYVCNASKFCSSEIMPHTITPREHELEFEAPAGNYKLYVRMYNEYNRSIELGMADEYRYDDGSYFIKEITIG